MRAIYVFLLAFALATGAFWATMLTNPPKTRAAPTAIADTWVVKKDQPPIADDYDPDF